MSEATRGPVKWKLVLSKLYALALMLVLVYAGVCAAVYLYESVFKPVRLPGMMMQFQQSTDAAQLRTPAKLDVPADQLRAPLEQFHRMPAVISTDMATSCTAAGCHSPLPHGTKSKIPVFQNYHVKFLACESCHTDIKDRPAAFVWMDAKGQTAATAPTLIRLEKFLDEQSDQIEHNPSTVHKELMEMVGALCEGQPEDRSLKEMRTQLESSEPGSPQWRAAESELQQNVRSHSEANYRFRLIPPQSITNYASNSTRMTDLSRQFLDAPANSPARKALNDQIHTGLVKKPGSCLMCHAPSNGMLDFAAAGYSVSRQRELANLQIARLLQDVREGKVFHLPDLVNTSIRSSDAP